MATNPFNLATPLPVETTFLANNGNPNTVYNTAATPFRGTGSQPLGAGTGAATAAPAFTPWTPANPPATMPTMPVNSAYHNPATQFWQNYAGVNRPVFSLADSGAWGSNPWAPPTAPPTTPPPTTPPTDTGVEVIDDDGSDIPTFPRGDGPSDNIPGGRGGGGTGGGGFGGFVSSGNGGGLRTDNGIIPTRPISAIIEGANNLLRDVSRDLGFNGRDGSFDVNQFADALLDVFLPPSMAGDWYNANVGSWNGLNVATSLLNSIIPGLGNLGQWLVDKLPEGNALRSWMQRNIVQNNADDALDRDNYMDFPQGGGGEGGGNLGGGRTFRPIGTSWGGGYWGTGNVNIGDLQKA